MERRQSERITPKPVKKIELSEKNVKLRTVVFIIAIAAAVTAAVILISSIFGVESGWRQIAADNSLGEGCAGDFILYYNIPKKDAKKTFNALTETYSEACVEAYDVFDPVRCAEGANNLGALNLNPNKKVKLAPELYSALDMLLAAGDTEILRAPVYERYTALFACEDDEYAAEYDPARNAGAAELAATTDAFVKGGELGIELLDDGSAILHVSDEYIAYAKENGIMAYVDLCWYKNAFRADYIAKALSDAGFTDGTLTSLDGCSRGLGAEGEFSLNVFAEYENIVYTAASVQISGKTASVSLRGFPASSADSSRFYRYADGTLVSYRDIGGFCGDSVTACSEKKSCGQMLAELLPALRGETLDEVKLSSLPDTVCVYPQSTEIRVTDKNAKVKAESEIFIIK